MNALFDKIDAIASAQDFPYKAWMTWYKACDVAARECGKKDLQPMEGFGYSDEFMDASIEALKQKIKRKANGHEIFQALLDRK